MQWFKFNNINSNSVIQIQFLMQLFKFSNSNSNIDDSNSVSSGTFSVHKPLTETKMPV